VMNWT